MISIEQKQDYFDFINRVLKVKFNPEMCVCISMLSDERDILGVVVYDRFTESGCEISVASVSPKFLNRAFLDVIFHYAYITAGKNRITALVECDNAGSLNLVKRLGFIEEAVLKEWHGKKDAVLFRMLRNECKWVKNETH